jgi:U3 small nucleolar RNA-associated protein 15
VHIYAPRTQKIIKTIARFKDVARSGFIRDDGKLLVAGDDSGLIQVSCYPQLGLCTPLIWPDF